MRRQSRTGRPSRKQALGRYDDAAGVWLVPVSDAWLDLLSRDWSRPVQLRAFTADGGDSYTVKVRLPAAGDAIDRLVRLVMSRDDWNESELRLEISAVLRSER